MRKFLVLFSLILLSSFMFGQSAKTALKSLEAGNFEEAIKIYEELVAKDPKKAEYHMNLGECYIRTPQKNSYAIATLEKAVELYTDKNEKGYIDSKFLLAKAYHVNLKFDEAIKIYNELVINKSYNKYREVDILQNEIRACEAAIEEFKKKKKLKIESPGNAINTEFTQHTPFLIESDGTFIYTSKEKTKFNEEKLADGQYDENVFFIMIDNENDQEPDPFDAPLNSKENEANCWVSKDGKIMFLYRDGDIFRSVKEGAQWTKPENFKAVNSKYDETHACMNDGGNVVYFSSNRPGGVGRKDIYYILSVGDDKWTSPVLLGPEVNTKFDDESPYIHGDGALYFSSKGHNSIGGYDIFKAKGISETKFGKAENLGMPVNSVEDDLFYFVTSDNKRAYFVSKRQEGKGGGDIYMVNYSDSSMYFLTVRGGAEAIGVSPEVSVFGVTDNNRVYNSATDVNGNYSLSIQRGENYFVLLEAEDHLFEAFTFSAPFNDEYDKNLGTKILDELTGNVHKVYSMEFYYNKSELSNENYLFLDAVSDFIKTHPDLALNISANQNSDEDLSAERKVNVKNYLVGKGVSEELIMEDVLTYDNEEDIFVTVTNKDGRVVVDNNTDVVENIEVPDKKGEYTIQLGAFDKKISGNHRFFKVYKGKVIRRNGPDSLNHYTYGEYETEADAEAFLKEIRAKGFRDAFIREISWYNR